MAEINPESGATQDGSFLDVTNSLYDEEPLCEAGEPCYVGELEDVLSGDALLELHLEERADHFLITADDAYDIYRKDQDWLEMAANLWRAMRDYFGDEYDGENASASVRGQLVKKYVRYQRNAGSLVCCSVNSLLYKEIMVILRVNQYFTCIYGTKEQNISGCAC